MDIPDLMTFMQCQFRKLLAAFNLVLVLLIPGVFSLAIPLNLSIFSSTKIGQKRLLYLHDKVMKNDETSL